MVIALALMAWVAYGIGAAGFGYAHLESIYSAPRSSFWVSVLYGVAFGPLALVVTWCMSGGGAHGWRLWETNAR